MTYVSLDMDSLIFVHKHSNHDIVSNLAWLEMPHRSVMIEKVDREYFLCKMTGLDLRMLYRNTTGQEPAAGTAHLVVREMLATLVEERLKATFADLSELEAQVALVEDDLYEGVPWKYVLGARRPTKQEELFPLKCNPLDNTETETAAIRAPQRRKARPATQRAATAAPPLQSPLAKAQRMSSVRPTIWAYADRMWQEAGSPKDKTIVLELRKKMMAALETEKGIKRTSSSNELGNWMKARIA